MLFEAVGIAEEHLGIHVNQKVMNGELVLCPQMYPFLQRLRVDYRGRAEGAGAERANPSPSRATYALGSSQSLRVAAVSASQSSGGLPRPSIFSNTA